MTVRVVLAAIGVFAAVSCAFVLGQRSAPRSDARTVVVERGGTREVLTVPADVDALRGVVREELARALAAQPQAAAAAAPKPAVEATTPDPAREAAFAKARGVLDAALSRGVWTDDDRNVVRAAMPSLSREQIEEINTALIPALNEGRLRTASGGFPL